MTDPPLEVRAHDVLGAAVRWPGHPDWWLMSGRPGMAPARVSEKLVFATGWRGVRVEVEDAEAREPERVHVHLPWYEIGNPDRPYYDPTHPHRYWVGPVEADDGGQ